MGVSSDNTDIALLINGGAGFAQRVAELSTAKSEFDKSLNDLHLGKDAVAANNEAGRILSEAKAKRDADLAALDEEVAHAREELARWIEQTRSETAATLTEARGTLVDAKAEQEAAVLAKEIAQRTLSEAKTEAASLVKDASAQAEDVLARARNEASDTVDRANYLEKAASAALAEAQASKAKYDAAIGRIKGALVE